MPPFGPRVPTVFYAYHVYREMADHHNYSAGAEPLYVTSLEALQARLQMLAANPDVRRALRDRGLEVARQYTTVEQAYKVLRAVCSGDGQTQFEMDFEPRAAA